MNNETKRALTEQRQIISELISSRPLCAMSYIESYMKTNIIATFKHNNLFLMLLVSMNVNTRQISCHSSWSQNETQLGLLSSEQFKGLFDTRVIVSSPVFVYQPQTFKTYMKSLLEHTIENHIQLIEEAQEQTKLVEKGIERETLVGRELSSLNTPLVSRNPLSLGGGQG